jgi:beta-1,4-mannosyl-glycoprotein beta-1,4-N-acetylglucosaminyltransferase
MRMAILNDYVDFFVIVEATKTYKGGVRDKLIFDINDYLNYKDKIRYFVYDGYYDLVDSWVNEKNIRRHLKEGFFDANDEDFVIFTDTDEILDPKIFDYFDPYNYEIAYVNTLLYQRKVNLLIMDSKNETDIEDSIVRLWVHPKLTTVKFLKRYDWKFFEIRHL